MLPRTIVLSKLATDRLRMLKGLTGLTPNVLARVAIMLALRDGSSLVNASVGDADGQVLAKDVLFGDHAECYEVLLNQFVHETRIDRALGEVISSLIESGVHKMGHLKTISDLATLAD